MAVYSNGLGVHSIGPELCVDCGMYVNVAYAAIVVILLGFYGCT